VLHQHNEHDQQSGLIQDFAQLVTSFALVIVSGHAIQDDLANVEVIVLIQEVPLDSQPDEFSDFREQVNQHDAQNNDLDEEEVVILPASLQVVAKLFVRAARFRVGVDMDEVNIHNHKHDVEQVSASVPRERTLVLVPLDVLEGNQEGKGVQRDLVCLDDRLHEFQRKALGNRHSLVLNLLHLLVFFVLVVHVKSIFQEVVAIELFFFVYVFGIRLENFSKIFVVYVHDL
jgi:hypothetical protein